LTIECIALPRDFLAQVLHGCEQGMRVCELYIDLLTSAEWFVVLCIVQHISPI